MAGRHKLFRCPELRQQIDLSMLAMPPSFVFGLLAIALLAVRCPRISLGTIFVCAALWSAGLALLRWDPAQAGLWFMD